MLEAIADAAPPDHQIDGLINRFVDVATQKWLNLPGRPEDKSAEFMFAGFRYAPPDRFRPYLAVVTNFADEGGTRALDAFRVDLPDVRPGYVMFAGAHGVIPADVEHALVENMKPETHPNAVLAKTLHLVRSAAQSTAAGGAIGQQCTSIVLPADLNQRAQSAYHTAQASRRALGTSFVEARGGEFGVWMTLDPEIWATDDEGNPVVVAMPPVGRRQPCPCGSGKRYKNCCGNPSR
jgi:hypothetical protein